VITGCFLEVVDKSMVVFQGLSNWVEAFGNGANYFLSADCVKSIKSFLDEMTGMLLSID
jgi:hypothetical protein